MPFAVTGIYTPATGATSAIAGDIIYSATWNAIHTDLSNALTLLGQQLYGTTSVTTATYVPVATDALLLVNRPNIVGINLPTAASRAGYPLTIKDVSGAANTNHITITPNGAETIEGAASLVIDMGYGSYMLRPVSGGWIRVDSTTDATDNAAAVTLSNKSILPIGATTVRSLAAWMADGFYIEDFGGGTGVANNTPAFNAAVAAGNNVRFKTGNYHFTTAPAAIAKLFTINGVYNATQQTVLWKDYNEATPTKGFIHSTAGEIQVNNVFIINNTGFTGGCGVSVIATVPMTGGMNNVRITNVNGTTGWDYSLFINGEANTSPIGIRTFYMNNVTLFGATVRAAYIKSVVHFDWLGGGVNLAGGTDGGLELTGTASAPSSENTISIDYVNGDLVLDRFKNTNIAIAELGGSITNTANTAGITGSGIILGSTPQNNWTDSSWVDAGTLRFANLGSINWGGTDVTITHGANTLIFANASNGYTFDTSVAVGTYVKTGVTTVSGLPAAAAGNAGARMVVTDATVTTFASIVAGTGGNGVPVYSDGTNWRIG